MRPDLLVMLVISCGLLLGMNECRAASGDKTVSPLTEQKNITSQTNKAQLLAAPTIVTLNGKDITVISRAYLNAMPGIPQEGCTLAGGLIVPVTLKSSSASSLFDVSITEVWVHSNGTWWSGSIRSDDADGGKRVVARGCRDGFKDGMQVDTIIKLTEDNQAVYLRAPALSLSSVH